MSNVINFIDPTAQVHPTAKVWHFARILAGAVLSEDTSVGSGAEVGRGSIIGNRTRISAGVFLPAHSIVGTDVFIGPNVTFTDDRYPRAGSPYKAEPPTIDSGASIGANSTILPGVCIGRGAMIGAGSVVTKDVPPHTTFYGQAAIQRTTSDSAMVASTNL